MAIRREAARRVKEDNTSVGASPQDNQDPSQGNQAPPQEKVPLGGQALIIPPAMTDEEIRSTFLTLPRAMTTQSQVVAAQSQAMTTQANQKVGPRVNQNASTMASRLRNFIRMSPPMLFGSKVDEDP